MFALTSAHHTKLINRNNSINNKSHNIKHDHGKMPLTSTMSQIVTKSNKSFTHPVLQIRATKYSINE